MKSLAELAWATSIPAVSGIQTICDILAVRTPLSQSCPYFAINFENVMRRQMRQRAMALTAWPLFSGDDVTCPWEARGGSPLVLGSSERGKRMGGPRNGTHSRYLPRLFSRLRCGSVRNSRCAI